jgi:isopenicillin N synthase-like dioxygenase
LYSQAEAAHAPRQSIAYFCNIDMDAVVEAIPTCVLPGVGAKYAPCTAGEHLMAKHSATVAGRLCYAPEQAVG